MSMHTEIEHVHVAFPSIGYGSCAYHARSMNVWCKESCHMLYIVLAKNLQRPFDTIAMRPPSPILRLGCEEEIILHWCISTACKVGVAGMIHSQCVQLDKGMGITWPPAAVNYSHRFGGA